MLTFSACGGSQISTQIFPLACTDIEGFFFAASYVYMTYLYYDMQCCVYRSWFDVAESPKYLFTFDQLVTRGLTLFCTNGTSRSVCKSRSLVDYSN